ncbi:hypothetical protein P692DRAFT_20239142 [Suillus brevipes Sb2]|nr:hypothetical protein P692DRAFT_20239142 [Suillus brevipes Sb2]
MRRQLRDTLDQCFQRSNPDPWLFHLMTAAQNYLGRQYKAHARLVSKQTPILKSTLTCTSDADDIPQVTRTLTQSAGLQLSTTTTRTSIIVV